MSYAIRMAGADLSKMSDKEIVEALSVAQYPDDEAYKGDFINLTLKQGTVKGKQKYPVSGFQTLDMTMDDEAGEAFGYLTVNKKGKATSKLSVTFTASRFGVHTASVPNTPFNVRLLAGIVATKGKITLSVAQDVEGAVDEIEELGAEIKKRMDYAKEYAKRTVIAEVHMDKVSIIDGLKKSFDDGFDQCSEYKKEVLPFIVAKLTPVETKALRTTTTFDELVEKFPMPKSDEELKAEADAKRAAKEAEELKAKKAKEADKLKAKEADKLKAKEAKDLAAKEAKDLAAKEAKDLAAKEAKENGPKKPQGPPKPTE